MRAYFKCCTAIVLATAAYVTGAQAEAQEADEIVVTAQKRMQDPKDVPISISAVSAADLGSLGIANGADIAGYVPGLVIQTTAGSSKPEIYLRGVGFNDFQSTAGSPVSVYNDGVLADSGFGLFSTLYDMERVEVLKGPQGTLWGANTTAGLINFVPRAAAVGKPLNGYATIEGGNFGTLNVEGAVGVPLGDTLAMRLSVRHAETSGYYDNALAEGPRHSGAANSDVIRGQLAWEPSNAFSARLVLSYLDTRDAGNPKKMLGKLVPAGATSCNNPGRPGTDCALDNGLRSSTDLYTVEDTDVPDFTNINRFTAALHLSYELGSGITLNSITSYEKSNRDSLVEDNGPNVPGDEAFTEIESGVYADHFKGFTQELRLSSRGNEKFNWQVGAFYLNNELDYFRGLYTFGFFRDRDQTIKSENLAAFAEVEYKPVDRLTVTAGARITHDRRSTTANVGEIFAAPQLYGKFFDSDWFFATQTLDAKPIDNVTLKKDWTEPSYKLALAYALTPQTNVYASFSHGFRGGQVNGGASSLADFDISNPEKLDAYEVGVKGHLRDIGLRFNVAGFYYDYKDKIMNVETPNPLAPGTGNVIRVENASSVEIYGLDADMDWAITDSFRISAGGSYIHARFKDALFELPYGGGPLDGKIPNGTPEFSFNIIGHYDWKLGDSGTLRFQANAVWQDKVFLDSSNADILSQDAYWLYGGRITYISPDQAWEFSGWVKNLGNKKYVVGGYDYGGELEVSPGIPRTFGASLSRKF